MTTLTLEQLETKIGAARTAYYNGEDSGLTDAEFDHLENQLRKMEPNHKLLTGAGAAVPALADKIKHTMHMGSQQKATDKNELALWLRQCVEINPNANLHLSHKLDGFSLALYYVDGRLQRAVTRGDGVAGEDITTNALRFKNVPALLKTPFTGGIRAEGIMMHEDWKQADPTLESNPRNLAAGISRRKDGENAECITIVPIDGEVDVPTEAERFKAIAALGFDLVVQQLPLIPIHDVASLQLCLDSILEGRSKLPYWIDGAVIRVNELDVQKKLGYTHNCPRGQTAWKYPTEAARATVISVDLSVGHSGKITPTANLTPVSLGGTIVKRANLHNWAKIAELDVHIGDVVEVVKSGEIIPQISSVIQRGPGRTPIAEPKACPDCGQPVGRKQNSDNSDSAAIYCVNALCPTRQRRAVESWIRKLDIRGIGDELLEALTTKPVVMHPKTKTAVPLINTIQDLYNLDDRKALRNAGSRFEALHKLKVGDITLGKKRAEKIVQEIERTRTMQLDTFLGSLGIPFMGRRKAKIIREKWNTLFAGTMRVKQLDVLGGWFSTQVGTKLSSRLVDNAEALGIPGIAASIQAELDQREPMIKALAQCINLISQVPMSAAVTTTGPLTGLTFCITGKVKGSRSKLVADIESHGGKTTSSVSKNVNYVVCSEAANGFVSQKLTDAAALAIPVIDEDALRKMFGGQ